MSQTPDFRILVVDDYEAIHDDYRRILAPAANASTKQLNLFESTLFGTPQQLPDTPVYDLASAYQGDDAVELVAKATMQEQPFAIAFVDMRMPPGYNGIQTIQKIWEIDPNIEVVICTAYSDHSWEEIRTELPFPDRFLILKKPFDTIEVSQLALALSRKWQLAREVEESIEELRNQKEFLGVTLMSIGDGVIVTDRNGCINLMNPMAEVITGWTFKDSKGLFVSDVFRVISDETGDACTNPVEKVLEHQMPYLRLTGNALLLKKDETEINIADNASPIRDKHGTIIGVALVFRDITHKLRVEREQLKNQKLESLGILAGGIAHDFNNLLTIICGNIDLARLLADNKSKMLDKLNQAKKASQRASGITNQLLTFSKGGEPIRKTALLDECVKETVDFVLHGSNVTFNLKSEGHLWPADIDSGQISQVIQNLIINSRQAMTQGGAIWVSLKNISSESAESYDIPSGDYIEIEIRDEGVGMAPEIIEQIFDPYFTTKKNGNGLGMAITHSIIAKHDGQIRVRSTEGEGTTFSIYLPAAREKQAIIDHQNSLTASPVNARILVMDDEEMVLDIARGFLEEFGSTVTTTRSGQEAIDCFIKNHVNESPFDIILVDLTVPGGMGGLDVLNHIHQISPNTPIIVSSGYCNNPIMSNYQDYGFSDCISKPFNPAELKRVILDSLTKKETIDEFTPVS